MSNKPKIHAFCDAGCKWEVPHKDDFDRSATYVAQNIDADGKCFLACNNEYKVFSAKDYSAGQNKNGVYDFACSIIVKYTDNGVEKTHEITFTNDNKYIDCFIFNWFNTEVYIGDNTRFDIIYEINGTRYTETITGTNIPIETLEPAQIYISGADKVLLFNPDARILVVGEKGEKGEKGGKGLLKETKGC